MCTQKLDGVEVSYFKRTSEERTACGVRELHPGKYITILDEKCDGVADQYQEGNDDTVFDHLFREDNEVRFKKFDERLKEIKSKVWE